MANYTLPHFGVLDTENLEDFYEVELALNGEKISLDLNFESNSVDMTRLEAIKQFIDNTGKFDEMNKEYLEKDYSDNNSDTVRDYVAHHLEYLDREELSSIVDFENEAVSPEIQLMKSLKIVRVGLYPQSESMFAIFDYSIGRELTNYLVVVCTDQEGNLNDIAMES